MNILKSPKTDPFESIGSLALAIRTLSNGQDHCGLLYCIAPPQVTLLHLAFNHDLRHETPTDSFCWLEVAMADPDKRLVAVLASRFGNAGNSVPYGFDSLGISIDTQSGQLRTERKGKGLTCATLVMLLFETHGFELLKVAEWPTHANLEWQTKMLDSLRIVAPFHAKDVEADVGARRFTPSEVVGAGSLATWPVGFNDARKIANRISREVRKLAPATE